MMVIAMMTPAITQASAIQKPPKTIQRIFRKSETGPIALSRAIGGGRKSGLRRPRAFVTFGVT